MVRKKWMVPKVTESVSLGEDGIITVTLNNLSADSSEKVDIQLSEKGYQITEARIVTNDDMHAYNTFDAPEEVIEADFTDYTASENGFSVTLPKNSVMALRLKKQA